MMLHTKGPWKAIFKYHKQGIPSGHVYGDDGTVVAIVGSYTDAQLIPYCKDRWDSDKRLIAAAPDLLEALQELLSVPGLVDGLPLHIYDMAYYAIQKATGEDD